MKIKIFTLLTLTMFCVLASASSKQAVIEDYYGNDNFQFVEMYDYLKINMEKKPFESFSIKVSNLKKKDLKNMSFGLRTSSDCFVKVVISDGDDVVQPISRSYVKLPRTTDFEAISFDFSNYTKDFKNGDEVYFIVYVQPGKSFTGTIDVKDICANTGSISYNDDEDDNELKLYPSPAEDYTYVQLPSDDYKKILVVDAYKRTVLRKNINKFSGESYCLNLSNLPNGVYTVLLEGNNETLYSNLMIR